MSGIMSGVMSPFSSERIVISGAGLAGSLLALVLARKGHTVELYEKRDDLRTADAPAGRSINLALSERGIHALRGVGLAERVLRDTIEMRGRMIHDLDGSTRLLPYGRRPDEVIRSVSRAGLNRLILEAAGADAGIELHFQSEIIDVDVPARTALVLGPLEQEWDIPFDVLFGADGAGSPVRSALQRDTGLAVSQDILGHGYKELAIESGPHGGFRMEPNALHIWPRGEYMLIALPNLDGSFTCTLFLPLEGDPGFDKLTGGADVSAFFEAQFPDAVPLLHDLEGTFFSNPTGTLGTIRCDSWRSDGDVLLIGDAAHAIVPFFGQGMNCAFEDCSVFDDLLDDRHENRAALFSAFERQRIPDANAIADMALENYVEMRQSVADPAFRFRRAVALELEERFPERFIPQYSLVSFHRIPYAKARKMGRLQAGLLRELCSGKTSMNDINWEEAGRRVMDAFPDAIDQG